MRLRITIPILFLSLLISLTCITIHAATVRLSPAQTNANHPASGAVVSEQAVPLEVTVEGVANLGAFDVVILYNGSILHLNGTGDASLGAFLGSTGNSVIPNGPVYDNLAGQVSYGAFASGGNPGPTGDGTLARIIWHTQPVVEVASSPLAFQSVMLMNMQGTPIPATVVPGEVRVCYFSDLDCDNDTDVVDIQLVASRWNTVVNGPNYEEMKDVDRDGDIDIADIQRVAARWNSHAPFDPTFTPTPPLATSTNTPTGTPTITPTSTGTPPTPPPPPTTTRTFTPLPTSTPTRTPTPPPPTSTITPTPPTPPPPTLPPTGTNTPTPPSTPSPTPGSNYIETYENGFTSGLANNWTQWRDSWSSDTENIQEAGDNSINAQAHRVTGGSFGAVRRNIPVIPGNNYLLEVRVKSRNSGNNGAPATDGTVWVEWGYDLSNRGASDFGENPAITWWDTAPKQSAHLAASVFETFQSPLFIATGNFISIWTKAGSVSAGGIRAFFDNWQLIPLLGGSTPTPTLPPSTPTATFSGGPTSTPGAATSTPTATRTPTNSPTPGGTPALLNPDFEGGFTGGVANNWQTFTSPGYSPTFLDETTLAHSGHSQKIDLPQPPTEKYCGIYQVMTTTPGQLYRVNFWYYSRMVGESYHGEDLETFVGFDSTGATDAFAANFYMSWNGLPSNIRDQWIPVSREFLAIGPQTTLFIKAWRKYAQHGGGMILVDDFMFETVNHPFTFAPYSSEPPIAPSLTGGNLLNNGDFSGGFTGGLGSGWQSWTASGSATWFENLPTGKIGAGHYNSSGTAGASMITMHPKTFLLMPPQLAQAAYIKSNYATSVVVGRLFIDEVNFWDGSDAETIALGETHAHNCYNESLIYPGIDSWQGFNEPWVQSLERARKCALFEWAFARKCHQLGIRACVLNLATGNPEPEAYDQFRPALALGDYVGQHCYGGPADNLMSGPQAPDFALRWRTVVNYYQGKNWRMPPAIYTESGTYGGWHGVNSDTQIRDDQVWHGERMQEDPWAVGSCIFVVGGFGVWLNWDIDGYPTIINGIRDWNMANNADARGGKGQQWQSGGSGFHGGLRQVINTIPGTTYWISGWVKYEFGPGGNPLSPPVALHIGADPTGQSADPAAGTLSWGADEITTRHLNSDTWYSFGRSVLAAGSTMSVWIASQQAAANPWHRVTVDALEVKAVAP